MDEARHRRHVDEAATAVFPEERSEHATAAHDAEQVDVDDPAPVFDRNLGDAAADRDPRVVHDDVDAAPVLLQPLRCGLEIGLLRHVAAERVRRCAETAEDGERLGEALVVDVADADAIARARPALGDGAAEAGGPAGDEDALARAAGVVRHRRRSL